MIMVVGQTGQEKQRKAERSMVIRTIITLCPLAHILCHHLIIFMNKKFGTNEGRKEFIKSFLKCNSPKQA